MRILTFTSLYPNAEQPSHGIFVEHRLRQLLASHPVAAEVVAPVPWFPFRGSTFGRYGQFGRVPRFECRCGIDIQHPRYPIIPKVGMGVAPLLMAAAVQPALRALVRQTASFDLIDAHYFYPDGVAAAILADRLHKPVVITARGTDINLISRYRLPRKMIRWAATRAAGIVAVSDALKNELVRLGVDATKVRVLRNGVDIELFRPVDREAARGDLGLSRKTLLSVGHLVELKGLDLVIRALSELPEFDLLIVGEGEQSETLKKLAGSLGVEGRVRFVGAVPQPELRVYYGAADALVLASSREGWANVLLESMACGTPVVATKVGGNLEVVRQSEAGFLAPQRTAHSIARSVMKLMDSYPDRAETRRYAERFGWEETSAGQWVLFNEVVQGDRRRQKSVREQA